MNVKLYGDSCNTLSFWYTKYRCQSVRTSVRSYHHVLTELVMQFYHFLQTFLIKIDTYDCANGNKGTSLKWLQHTRMRRKHFSVKPTIVVLIEKIRTPRALVRLTFIRNR